MSCLQDFKVWKIFQKYIFVSEKYLVCKLCIFEHKRMYICIMDIVNCYILETRSAEQLIRNVLFAKFVVALEKANNISRVLIYNSYIFLCTKVLVSCQL